MPIDDPGKGTDSSSPVCWGSLQPFFVHRRKSPRGGLSYAVSLRLRNILKGCTGVATRPSPVDWEMNSNKGFYPVSGAWRGRGVGGKKRFANRIMSHGNFLSGGGVPSPELRSLGRVAAVL